MNGIEKIDGEGLKTIMKRTCTFFYQVDCKR